MITPPCSRSGRGCSGDDEDDYDGGRRVAHVLFLRAISICATVANSPPHLFRCQLCPPAHLFEIDLLVIAGSWIKVS